MASAQHRSRQLPATVSIALVDDHPLVLAGLQVMIESEARHRVVLKACNGREFIHLLPTAGQVDVAVVDLSMPVMDGFQTIAWIVANRPQIIPVALTFSNEEKWLARARQAGACGCILKDVDEAELHTAFDDLMHTGYYRPTIPYAAHLRPTSASVPPAGHHSVAILCTDREIQFMQLIVAHPAETYDQIADRMSVSRSAIEYYARELSRRFDLHSNAALVHFAVKHGFA